MSEPFVGEIRMFAGNFAPRGWALCNGQLLAITQNDALFSLFGTTYGGDGRTTFGLPDMRGRMPVHAGNGPGLAEVRLGSKGGTDDAQLSPTTTVKSGFSIERGIALNQTTAAFVQSKTVQPALCLNFIVALVGIYPSRA
ncbi:phage tail protein [Bacterioplanoides pacificum]|uniref:Phage tail protein n=1 Tax=Bacterioplanoides pacificum TaxID=1171596 RepID=A0ABV7VWH1_9GAMM